MRALVVLALLSLAAPALSKPLGNTPIELSAGAKGFASGFIWTDPRNEPAGVKNAGQGFYELRGGPGGGGGIFVEGRFWKYLGLEMDLLFDWQTMWETTDYKVNNVNVAKTEQQITWQSVRLPIIFKGILPIGISRLSLGIGPEFVWSTSAGADVEFVEGGNNIQNKEAALKSLNDHWSATEEDSTRFLMDFGVTVQVHEHVSIPFDIRAGVNTSQGDEYFDRVDEDALTGKGEFHIKAQPTWEIQLMAGAAYEF